MLLVKHPVLCNYYLTYRCNASCDFCDIWEKPSPFVTIESFKENLADLKKLKVKVIDFTGGEPLLHKGLGEMLSLAKKEQMITTVTTNGLLYPKRAKELSGKVDMLHFSLDSASAEVHDKLRGVKCFDRVMESIAIAKSLGERPDILFTVHNENIHEIEPIYQEICVPNDLVLIINPIFEYNTVDNHGGLDDLDLSVLKMWGKKKNVFLNEAFLALRKDGGNHVLNPICKAGTSTVVITPENKLAVPCYHLSEKEFEIKGSLYELFHTEEVSNLRKSQGLLPACEGCTVNCYMQPSFTVNFNKYWLKSVGSNLKYNFIKGTWKNLI